MSFATAQRTKSNSFHRSAQDLKCKNGCGFYGNPEWQGYCSKCHREVLQKKSRPEPKSSSSRKLDRSFSDAQESSLSLAFSKFEEKKKQQTEKKAKTLKSFFNRGNTTKDNTYSPRRDHHSGDYEIYEKEFGDFLKTLPEPATTDVKKQVKLQLNQLLKTSEMPIDERSEMMQDFYQNMSQRFEMSHLYQDLSSETVEKLMDHIEKFLLTRVYRDVFQQISSENEEKDLALQKRIRSLNWVSSRHLYADINENHPEVRDLIDKAITDILEMDSKRAPQEKVNSVVCCCKNIFSILSVCRGSPASADELLPAMVYIVLKANPPLMQSNIKFVTYYSIPARLRSGEGGYYFTNLCCAVQFIENLTAESLNLSKEEYDRYVSGVAVPPGANHPSEPICDGLRLFYQNLTALNELGERQEKLIADAASLQSEMDSFKEEVSQEALLQTENFHTMQSYIIPADVDINLVPKFLRSRVIKEKAKEDILVQIDSETNEAEDSTKLLIRDPLPNASVISPPLDDPLADFTGVPGNDPTSVLPPTASSVPVLHPALSRAQKGDSFSNSDVLLANGPQTSGEIQQHCVQDINFPLEMLENTVLGSKSSELQNSTLPQIPQTLPLEFETLQPSVAVHIPDPLSPEAAIPDDSLILPPPLEPVRIQSCHASGVDGKKIS